MHVYHFIGIVILVHYSNTNYCDKDVDCSSENSKNRYLFYDVNPPEGFNLRRDVYMRFAIFAHYLNTNKNLQLDNFKLVLPPWILLYHWKKSVASQLPWSKFFDLESLKRFTPVVEMHHFFEDMRPNYSKLYIDEVYVLQNFDEMFKTGKFENKMQIKPCKNKVNPKFYYYDNITSNNVKCLSFHGHVSQLTDILKNTSARTVLFDHGEIALHDHFGSDVYWKARRSMKFNKQLYEDAANFRKFKLNSTDELDNTIQPNDWIYNKPKRTIRGGPYLGVHLRRADFVWGRPDLVPTIEYAAEQIKKLAKSNKLNKIFIATDADQCEFKKLKELLTPTFQVYRYMSLKQDYLEGELAILDQIICSHAKYFVGTHESTFSFRIQEEREIMGFPEETTFNCLCGPKNCQKPSKWKIVY